METTAQLRHLTAMHPNLLWQDFAAAAVVVLPAVSTSRHVPLRISCDDIPGFADNELKLHIDCAGFSQTQLTALRRTYDAPRLVEMAAIAVAGLALYHGGGHEIRDVALRGSAADYLVDAANCRLEIAGRSRRSDLEVTWQQKLDRLTVRDAHHFYVCVVEFETPSAMLTFVE